MLIAKKEESVTPDAIAALKDAFEHFNESSSKLEAKYQRLLEETAVLRESLRQKDLELKRSERLALLGETAAALAHEVRNPLGAIRLFVSLLEKEVSDRPDARSIIDQITTSISTLDHVVSNILHFSKEKKLAFAPVNVHSIIREQALSFPKTEANTATLDIQLSGNPYVIGNEGALRQVIYNLLLNAHQAVRYRGRISIAASDSSKGELQIVVKDDGKGISNEIVDTLFDPFVTTKNEGTGLGLAIVKRCVVQHHGEVLVKNDGGAVFTVLLPRTQEGGK